MHYGAVSFREKIKASVDNFPKNAIILFAINFIKNEQKTFGITFITCLHSLRRLLVKPERSYVLLLNLPTGKFATGNKYFPLSHTQRNYETLSLWEIAIRRQMFGDRN